MINQDPLSIFDSPDILKVFNSGEVGELKKTYIRTIQEGIKEKKSWQGILTEIFGYSNYIFEAAKAERENIPHCKMGCSYCCYLQVHLSRLELKLILDHVQSLPQMEKKRIKRVAATNRSKIEKNPELNRVELKLPCPFLKDKKCTIYDIRPLSCRGYNSVKVSDCKKGFGKKADITHEGNQFVIYFSALLALFETDTDIAKITDLPTFLKKETKIGDLIDGLL